MVLNHQFTKKYVDHMKEAMKEVFIVVEEPEIPVTDNTKLINLLYDTSR